MRQNEDLKVQQNVCLSKLNNQVSLQQLKLNRARRSQEETATRNQIKGLQELLSQTSKLSSDLDGEIHALREHRKQQVPLINHKDRHLDLLEHREEEKLGLNKTLELKTRKLQQAISEVNFRINQEEMEILKLQKNYSVSERDFQLQEQEIADMTLSLKLHARGS